jgi:predicted ATPase
MLESIYIKNLGPIKEVCIDTIKPTTVFIGESGSGKSTLMKAIALFRWLNKMQHIRSYLKHSKMSKSPIRFRLGTYIKNCGFEKFIDNSTELKYRTTFPSGNIYEIGILGKELFGVGTSELVAEEDLYFNKVSFVSETRTIIPLWSDRGASLAGTYLGFYFHEVYGDFDAASDAMNELSITYLDVKFSVEQEEDLEKKFSIQSNAGPDFKIDFKHSSSGTQSAVPITLIAKYFGNFFKFEDAFNRSVLNYLSSSDELTEFKAVKNLNEIKKKVFLHIEEPELSLFPQAQCELINDLIEKCFIGNDNAMELMISTHSPYIINHLNLLIKAGDRGVQIGGASLSYEDLSVYQLVDGELVDLMVQNARLVNTNPLSDTMNHIYEQYSLL